MYVGESEKSLPHTSHTKLPTLSAAHVETAIHTFLGGCCVHVKKRKKQTFHHILASSLFLSSLARLFHIFCPILLINFLIGTRSRADNSALPTGADVFLFLISVHRAHQYFLRSRLQLFFMVDRVAETLLCFNKLMVVDYRSRAYRESLRMDCSLKIGFVVDEANAAKMSAAASARAVRWNLKNLLRRILLRASGQTQYYFLFGVVRRERRAGMKSGRGG